MTKSQLNGAPATEWAGGWRVVVAAACGVGTTWHFFQIALGLFIIPMQTDFGWSRSQVAIGPIGGLLSIFFYPFAGMAIDRYGPRRIALLGLTLLSGGLLLFATVPANTLVFYTGVVCLAAIGSISNQMVFSKGVASWFARRFGTAVGLMMSGVTIIGALGIPLIARVISRFGWRAGFVTLALIIAIIGIPANFFWFRSRPVSIEEAPNGGPPPAAGAGIREAFLDRRFWLLAAAIGCAAVPVGGYMTHLQPILVDRGIAALSAASFGSMFVISIGVGRIVVGTLLDRFYPSFVSAAALSVSAVGVILLAYLHPNDNSWLGIAVAISMIGLAQGAESDYVSYFTRRIFGVRNFSRLVGILLMIAGGCMAVGGMIFAALFDHYKDYQLAVRGSAFMFFLAALIFSTIRVPPLPAYGQIETTGMPAGLPVPRQ